MMRIEPFEQEFRGEITPRDKDEDDYKYLKFFLPEGYDAMEVSYEYSKDSGCVIDIGIIDSKGSFRGWSGSNKPMFSISARKATPGYIAGETPPGNWLIILGLAKVATGGCRYRVVVKASRLEEPVYEKHDVEEIVAIGGGRERSGTPGWIKGDLHVHSHHSDGKHSVCELVKMALEQGLDYIALTDHSTVSQVDEIRRIRNPPVLLIPGVEVTTYHGHLNVWGGPWFDFRRRRLEDFVSLIHEVHEKDLIISIDHPRDLGELCIGCDFEFKEVRGFDAVEVWNGPWFVKNWEPLAWWHRLLSEGFIVTAVGGSDYHGGENAFVRLSEPTTWVHVDSPSVENVINSIRRGRVFVSRSSSGPTVQLTAYGEQGVFTVGDVANAGEGDLLKTVVEARGGEGALLRLITSQGVEETVPVSGEPYRHVKELRLEQSHMFIRAELGQYADPYSVDLCEEDTILALTNPIYLRTG